MFPLQFWFSFADLGDDDHNATYWSYVQEVIDSLEPLQPELIPEGKT